jgi:hypothetical protein
LKGPEDLFDERLLSCWANFVCEIGSPQTFTSSFFNQSGLQLAYGLSVNRSLISIALDNLPKDCVEEMFEILRTNPILTRCSLNSSEPGVVCRTFSSLAEQMKNIIGKFVVA